MTTSTTKKRRWTMVLLTMMLLSAFALAGCGNGEEPQEDQTQTTPDGAENPSQEETPDVSEDDNTGEDAPADNDANEDSEDSNGGEDNKDDNAEEPSEGAGQDDSTGNAEEDSIMALRAASSLQSTVEVIGDKNVVTNPEAITVIVNKERSLPDGYEPTDLVEPDVPFSFDEPHQKRHLRQEAADALEELFAAAEEDNIELRAVSGYRSYDRQVAVFNSSVERNGEEYALRVSAQPGKSEHQTGLSIDVSSPSVGNVLEEILGDTEEGKWLAEHAPEFGFIIRYLEGREETTGYVYEPWHIRYVGKELAPDIAASGLTLEEYFDEANIKL
ncbi:D-alanyl-D-alanine carboxypeptidase family protein [Paenibacillus urinalis]|uniref:D-alanyl-D-alanine carboxypeptidase family protein n=1 Tax=Paenibacillus urinalis TaxID=521520 RepID=A0ABY7XAN1_9BACL|nr:D-alanyl-D-alanine carboxypeptidase family protein [Paenibacillus urinalis]WDH99151.1 D-alanyl-D-alanine carboxypeptidase family protein [Paenibacillus urinalis]WDI02840.1 D-alanyl-D-alanine carboxypeptidase family protein [Paenibacillus urinalis]